ncbi:hypothetical protein [Rhizobium leguminosarum]|jgi:hypothetical protein|nr:hypothetical protein [Rhizobium leguminosarum]
MAAVHRLALVPRLGDRASASMLDELDMSVISFDKLRDTRERPDAQFVRKDEHGQTMYLFALEYEMGPSTWSAKIWAYSFEDAEMRVKAMRESLAVCGQMHASIGA